MSRTTERQRIWNTEAIVSTLKGVPRITKVKNEGQGGDVDTDNLVCHIEGTREKLFIKGFVIEGSIDTPSNCAISAIEVTDGLDSMGGLMSSNETTAVVYGIICARLRRLGFHVVPRLKDYF